MTKRQRKIKHQRKKNKRPREKTTPSCPLLDLPAELRLQIYEDLIALSPAPPRLDLCTDKTGVIAKKPLQKPCWDGLLLSCRALYNEFDPLAIQQLAANISIYTSLDRHTAVRGLDWIWQRANVSSERHIYPPARDKTSTIRTCTLLSRISVLRLDINASCIPCRQTVQANEDIVKDLFTA